MKSLLVVGLLATAVASAGFGCGVETRATRTAAAPQDPKPQNPRKKAPKQDPKPASRTAQDPKPSKIDPAVKVAGPKLDPATDAFPPTVSDSKWHQNAWERNDCLRCHETGVADAPQMEHKRLPQILRTAKCRTCHVFVPGSKPVERPAKPSPFESWAFPPMIPASGSHTATWERDDCLMCHETGIKGAPKVVHKNMPRILLESKCRSCHVQVRAVEATRRSHRER